MAIARQETERTGIENQNGMVEYLSGKIGRALTVEEVEEAGVEAQASLREGKCPICLTGNVQSRPGHSCGLDHRCDSCKMPFTEQEIGSDNPMVDKGYSFIVGYTTLSSRHDREQKK